jgi:hypothetical protein
MELLLNLIWIALAIGSFLTFARRRHSGSNPSPFRSLLALACVLLLLFPIISASDDLHPSQALLEEASRRVPLLISPLDLPTGGSAIHILPMLLLALLLALVELQPLVPLDLKMRLLDGRSLSPDGRAPPICCN